MGVDRTTGETSSSSFLLLLLVCCLRVLLVLSRVSVVRRPATRLDSKGRAAALALSMRTTTTRTTRIAHTHTHSLVWFPWPHCSFRALRARTRQHTPSHFEPCRLASAVTGWARQVPRAVSGSVCLGCSALPLVSRLPAHNTHSPNRHNTRGQQHTKT
jgi:hypothetical protein